MNLAAVHIPPVYSIPPAILVAAAVVWYWLRLGRADVPVSRRRIRRTSLAIMFVSLPVFVAALSVIDWNVRGSAYVITWSVALLCLLLIIVTAIMDALNNVRLLRAMQQEELLNAAVLMVRSAQQQQEAEQRERQVHSEGAPTQHNGHRGRKDETRGDDEARGHD